MTTKNKIMSFVKNSKIADALAEAIAEDAPRRHTEVVGFGSSESVETESLKEFGDGEVQIDVDAKLMKFKVASTDTVFYPNADGETEAFAFDPLTLESLGNKLEGVPLVIGDGHEAELPYAYFLGEHEVVEEDLDSGRKVKSLYQWAKLREDEDAPVNFEALLQNPGWDVNGGDNQFSGSLKFTSTDVPYFYEDGAKVNYMTSPVPVHFAGVDIPVMQGAGLVEKTFGKVIGDEMTEEIKTEVHAEAPEIDIANVIGEKLANVDLKEMLRESVISEITANITAGLGETDTVAKSEYDAVVAERDGLLKAKDEAELDALRSEIVGKVLGADVEAEVAAEWQEENLKEFGRAELEGYLAAAIAGSKKEETKAEAKTFGKGRVDMTNPDTKRKFPKVSI